MGGASASPRQDNDEELHTEGSAVASVTAGAVRRLQDAGDSAIAGDSATASESRRVQSGGMDVDGADDSGENETPDTPLFGYPSDPSLHQDASRLNLRYSRAPRFLASLSSTSVSTAVSSTSLTSLSSIPSNTSLVVSPTFKPKFGAMVEVEEGEGSKTGSQGFDASFATNPAHGPSACSGPASPSLSPAPSPPPVFRPSRLLSQV